jgi:hypothetical protein
LDKQFILTILSRRRGKNHKNDIYFRGTYEQARETAQELRKSCTNAGDIDARVEIWQIIATEYKGTIRR